MLKRKKVRIILPAVVLAITLMLSVKVNTHAKEVIVVNPSSAPVTQEELHEMVETATKEFYENSELKEELEKEIQSVEEVIPAISFETKKRLFYVLTYEGKSMKFLMNTFGDPAANGKYPLYICLHGGGDADTVDNNDGWLIEFNNYYDSISSGILVACRGITDTWDMHFREESYQLYERLIEAMIVNYGADPDRVYLHGYSAGGDGVYQITPRLADRFAAANMSAGHPNDVSLLNLSNFNFCQQVGIRDYYSEDAMRSVNVARYDQILSDYQDKYGFGYEHTTFIHVPEGHIFDDYDDVSSSVLREPFRFAECAVEADALDLFLDVFESVGQERDVPMLSYYYEDDEEFDNGIKDAVTNTLGLDVESANTNAIRYVSSFTRSAAPEQFVWDLSTRAPRRGKDSFYWLEADSSVDKGIITASFDRAGNTITVEPNPDVNGDFAILFHPDLVDVTRPVTIKTPKGDRKVLVNPSEEFLRASMYECGDPKLGCVGKIMYSELVSEDVTITIPGETILTQGMEKALSAATEPEGIPVTWSSSDTKVALVDGNGVVTGLKAGTSTITAAITVDGKEYSASCKVTVVPAGYIPSDASGGGHTHKFVWETIEATQDADGELRYRCENCGEIQTRVPLTAYNVFNRNTAEKIRKAGKDATVKVETNKWISFHKMVMEALAERPDVTLEISFLDKGYKGNRCTVVIPKGTDTMSLVDKNGFTGFLYLGGRFGMKTN